MEGRESINATGNTPSAAPHSPWHSPVPYLFGGLAAMLGLIAFALLILACSYWKLSAYLESGEGERDLEAGEGKGDDNQKGGGEAVMEQKFLVIMAGDVKPTFLATPISSSSNSRPSSFGDKSENSCCSEKIEQGEGEKQQPQTAGAASDVHVDHQVGSTDTRQASSQAQGSQSH